MERSIFADVTAYQLNGLNRKLNESIRKICIVLYGMKTIKEVFNQANVWPFFQSACSELNELPALKNGAQCTAGCETWIVLASFVLFPESNLK